MTTLIINGETRQFDEIGTLDALIDTLDLRERLIEKPEQLSLFV